MVVETTGTRWANASRIFRRVPLPNRTGTTTTSARASSAVMSGTRPVTVMSGGRSRASTRGVAWPTSLMRAPGICRRISGAMSVANHVAPSTFGS